MKTNTRKTICRVLGDAHAEVLRMKDAEDADDLDLLSEYNGVLSTLAVQIEELGGTVEE